MKFSSIYVAVFALYCIIVYFIFWVFCMFDTNKVRWNVSRAEKIIESTAAYRRLKPHRKIILLTYMRSGSTFTGDILSAHPDVFYVFEPLHFVNHPSKSKFTFLNNKRIYLNKTAKNPLLKQVVSGILNCTFHQVDIGTLKRRFIMKSSRSTLFFYNCLRKHPRTSGLLHCLPSLYRACYQATVTVTKTIRLPMTLAEMMIQQDPDVRVIHLVRDPRATIVSQRKMHGHQNFKSHVEIFCERLLCDLQAFEKIKAKYPDRARLVLYENLADNPLKISKDLYKFMNVSPSANILDHIRNITMSGYEKKNCPMCISKANSSRTSQEWRIHLSFDKAQFIDTKCSDTYFYLGYKRATTEFEYRNTSFPMHTWPLL